jgi:N-acetylglucosamine-6-sulfatase
MTVPARPSRAHARAGHVGHAAASAPLARLRVVVAVAVTAAFVVGGVFVGAGQAGAGALPSVSVAAVVDERPNVLLITTDDMRLSDLEAMPLTRQLLGDGGVRPGTALAPNPLCCPARAEILTGQYATHNGVRANDGVHGGYPALREPDETLPAWLEQAGYRTSFVGKFLNGYRSPESPAPAGWTDWHPWAKGLYEAYGVAVTEGDGTVTYPDTHSNDLVRDYTAAAIDEFAGPDPFFIWSSYVSPHGRCLERSNCSDPPEPALRHRGLFPGLDNPAEASPSYRDPRGNHFGEGVSGDLPTVGELRYANRKRWQALQSVDEGIASTLGTLEEHGELDSTLIIFTSDNGYLLGEHAYEGKNVPYEEALRIPFLVRGPGLPAGAVRPNLEATLVDIAPTIAAAAGATPTRSAPLDGRDLLPGLARASAVRSSTQLLEIGPSRTFHTSDRPWTLRGVRTGRYTYLKWAGSPRAQLFDRRTDPAQLRNLTRDRRYRPVLRELRRRLWVLSTCSGADECRQDFGPTPPVRRR